MLYVLLLDLHVEVHVDVDVHVDDVIQRHPLCRKCFSSYKPDRLCAFKVLSWNGFTVG